MPNKVKQVKPKPKPGLSFEDKMKICWAFVTVAIATIDTVSDWWAFQFYIRLSDTWSVNYTYLAVCVVSAGLLIFEVRNAIVAYHIYSEQDRTGMWDKWEGTLHTHQEVVSFLVLLIEDIPAVIVLFFTFREGNCLLYMRVFRETIAANLALLGSNISAIFKLVGSFRLCFCRCHCGMMEGCRGTVRWAFCHVVRPTLAIMLMIFTFYLYNEFNDGTEPRIDCLFAKNASGNFTDATTTVF